MAHLAVTRFDELLEAATSRVYAPRASMSSSGRLKTRDGKVVSWHVYHDTIPFLTALGLVG